MLLTTDLFIPVLLVFMVLLGLDVARPWIAPAVPAHPQITALLGAVRRRILIAVAVGVIVAVALALLSDAYPSLRGIPLGLAPAAAGSAALVAYAAAPPRAPAVPGEPAESLPPPRPGSFLPTPIVALALLMLAVQIAVLLFTGATANQDDLGRERIFTLVYGTSDQWIIANSAPYAGWFYGVPLLVATAILALATVFALWRVSSTTVVPRPELALLDAGWRRTTSRIVAGLASVVLAVQLHATALISGSSILNTDLIDGFPRRWTVAGWTLSGIGGAAWVVALGLVVVSLRSIEQLPEQVGARTMPPPPSATANSHAEARLEGGPSCS